jgi:hypothetical protein
MENSRARKLALFTASAAAFAAFAALEGCAAVKPWDRNVLARDDMQIVSDPLENAIDQHIYFSKEASSGGQGFGGGGCGCN